MKSIGRYFCPTVLWVSCVYMACRRLKWPMLDGLEIGVLLAILIQYNIIYS